MQEKKTHSCSIIIVKALLFTFLLLFTTHSFCVGAHPSLLVAEIIENNEHSIENEAHLYYPFSIEKKYPVLEKTSLNDLIETRSYSDFFIEIPVPPPEI